jgi:hypothetical protein
MAGAGRLARVNDRPRRDPPLFRIVITGAVAHRYARVPDRHVARTDAEREANSWGMVAWALLVSLRMATRLSGPWRISGAPVSCFD